MRRRTAGAVHETKEPATGSHPPPALTITRPAEACGRKGHSMLTEERQLMMWAATTFAAMYLSLTFIAGAWIEGRSIAWKLAVLSAGLAYLCTLAKAYEARGYCAFNLGLARLTFWASLVSGAIAGAALI